MYGHFEQVFLWLNRHDEFVIIVLDLVFERHCKLNIRIVKASWGIAAIVTIKSTRRISWISSHHVKEGDIAAAEKANVVSVLEFNARV